MIGSGTAPAPLSLLGPLRVLNQSGSEVALGGPKPRAVLATLLLEPNRVVSADRIVDNVWGESAVEGAPATLQVYVHNLRKALEDVTGVEIVTRRPGYALETTPEWVDHVRFDTRTQDASISAAAGRYDDALALLDDGLALWRGNGLDDLLDFDWAFRAATRLQDQRLDAIEQRNEIKLAMGASRELIGPLEEQVAANPLRERLWAQLMLALYREGRQRDGLAAFERVRTILLDELGLDPGPKLRDLEGAILRQDPSLLWSDASAEAPAAVPRAPEPLSALIGRRRELSELQLMLGEHALLSIVGPPGSGKTRLALEAVRQPSDQWKGCVYLDLSTIEHGGEAERTIDDTLSALEGHGGVDGVLLVLDGCEHLAHQVVPVIERWRAGAKGLRILATSQVPLGARGETVLSVDPLPVPVADAGDVEALLELDAVRLFLARATAALASFNLSPSNAAAVVHIVRTLDGVPLAIELAAAQVRLLSVAELARQLDESLEVLDVSRRDGEGGHRTLRDAMRWSLDSLNDETRAVFLALSTLVGPFTMDDARAVAPPESANVVATVLRLVDRSLVSVSYDAGHNVGYRVLEPIRRVAALDLAATGLADDIRTRHARNFIALATATGPLSRQWTATMQRILENLTAALRFSIESGATHDAARLAILLSVYYRRRGSIERAHAAVRSVLPIINALEPDDAMDLLLVAGSLAVERRDCAAALMFAADAAARAEQADDDRRRAHALLVEAAARREIGELDLSRDRLAATLELFEGCGDISGTASALGQLGMLERDRGEGELAMGLLRQGLARLSSVRGASGEWGTIDLATHQRGSSLMLSEMGAVAASSGELDRAGEYFTESLLVSVASEHRNGVATTLEAIAVLATQRRMPDAAAMLLGSAETLLNADEPTSRRGSADHLRAPLVAEIGPTRVDEAMQRGRGLSFDQAVRLGLDVASRAGADQAGALASGSESLR